jgi:hypothetical protein
MPTITEYIYAFSAFPNGKVDPTSLTNEIQLSSIVTALDHIDTNTACDIWFKDVLSASDKTTLDTVVSLHQGNPTSTLSTGLSFGDIVLSSVTTTAVRRTTYTEQTVNFTGSIVSSSTNDTSTGTGARTVTIIYLDQTGAGPFTETVTLNGTTAVNFVNTNHCYIENIIVASVGSGGSNAGTITLKTGVGGAGTTVGAINIGDNRTFWAHHYIPSGKTNRLTSMSGTVTGGPGSFLIKTIQLNVGGAVETQVTDTIRVTSQSPTTPRNYGTPIKTVGPARVLAYTVSESTNSLTYRLSFDYYDQ